MNTNLYKINFSFFKTKRLIFQNSEVAPKTNEKMTGPEKTTDAQIAAEVAPQSPAQIVANSWAVVVTAGQKQAAATQSMAGLIKTAGVLTPINPEPTNEKGEQTKN